MRTAQQQHRDTVRAAAAGNRTAAYALGWFGENGDHEAAIDKTIALAQKRQKEEV